MSFYAQSTYTITNDSDTVPTYADSTVAEGIGGSAPSTSELAIANAYINQLTNRRGFGVTDTVVEIFDVDKLTNRRGILQLSFWPVISVTSVIDDQRDTAEILTENDDYLVYKQRGEVKLIDENIDDIKRGTGTFKLGDQTVKVTYTFGYASVPQDIKDAATWYTAFLSELNASNSALKSGNAILKSTTIGNYKEAYDTENTLLNKKYQFTLNNFFNRLIAKYRLESDY